MAGRSDRSAARKSDRALAQNGASQDRPASSTVLHLVFEMSRILERHEVSRIVSVS